MPLIESIINDRGRIIIIGDLHGCWREADDMLESLRITDDDVVIFAGDIVDRGEHSGRCVDLAMQYRAVLGNHDEKALKYQKQRASDALFDPALMPATHRRTFDQLRPAHYRWMASLPHVIRLPQYGSAVVHAGALAGRSLEEQTITHLLRIQIVNPEKGNDHNYWAWDRNVNSHENALKVAPDDSYRFWTHFWNGPERIIFGHSVLDKPLITEHAIGIDGGCCFGRELWAWVLPDERLHRVPSRQPKGVEWVGYLIHDDVANGQVRTF